MTISTIIWLSICISVCLMVLGKIDDFITHYFGWDMPNFDSVDAYQDYIDELEIELNNHKESLQIMKDVEDNGV